MSTQNNKPDNVGKTPILVDTSGNRAVPAADAFGRGAKDGQQVVAERRTREVGEWYQRS